MLRRKVKSMLSLVISASMIIGTLGSAQIVNAEELTKTGSTEGSFLWEEVVDDLEPVEDEVDVDTEAEEVTITEYEADEAVRVLIVFEEDAVVDAGFTPEEVATNEDAVALSEEIEEKQNEVIELIEEEVLDGESLETRYSFTILTNAVSAEIAYGQVEDIEAVDGVAAVYVCPVYEVQKTVDSADPNTMTSGEMVGSYTTWSSGYTGAGMRIAVIDTGLDTDHPSFDEAAFLYSLEETATSKGDKIEDYDLLDEEEIATVVDSLNASAMYSGLTASDLYRTAKVAYGFNYVDEGLNVTHDYDSQGDHGTHVSGIATANKYVPTVDGFSTQKLGVVGIAPDAQLLVMKVFGANGGAYPDDYIAAIEDALLLGADTINLSLGSSSAGESVSTDDYVNSVMDKLTGTDTVVSISAGNAYSWSQNSTYGYNLSTDVSVDTVGSPGSYTNAFTVASAINSGMTGNAATFGGEYNAFYSDGSSANNKPFVSLDTTGNGTEYEYVLLPTYGEASDYEGLDVTGKIVLVSRGSISFYVKHDNAQAAGAVGCLVYNNTTGTIGMNLTGSSSTIPCASITKADANAIASISELDEETGVYTGKVVISKDLITDHNSPDGYLMSPFSSWGVPGDLSLKPEITAPGGSIYSTLTDGQYGLMSGTSMAAPSVAGITALVLQYIEENGLDAKTGLGSRALAQALLMSTATQLVDQYDECYSPRKQGAGLANAELATTTPAYILVGDEAGNDGKVKVELGDDPDRTGAYNFDFTVYNMTDETVYYDLDSTLLTESVASDGTNTFILNAATQLDTKISYTTDSKELLFDLNSDNEINVEDAKLFLQVVNKSKKSSKIDACEDDFDLDSNGVIDTNDVRLFLVAVNDKNSEVDLTKEVLAVKDSEKISASINLVADDREYIEACFENGIYVEGYVQLGGKVDLSIPVLAFYGNWTDSSMFEPYNYLTNDQVSTYSGLEKTNYVLKSIPGSSSLYYFGKNLYATDDEYIADRNAMSSENGTAINQVVYSLIRNAADVTVTISNAETGEVYYTVDKGAATAEFYYASQGTWQYTSSKATLGWSGTDSEGNALPDGTKVNVTVTALPSYYNDETKVPGKGVNFTTPLTIDNVAPTATANAFTMRDNKITVTTNDNQYAAAVLVYAANKKSIIGRYAVNQTAANTATDVTIEYPNSVFYVKVLDYAGNSTVYRVNMSGEPDVKVADSITLSDESITLMKNGTAQLSATVGPETILDDSVVWSSEDESVATVDENGIVKGVNDGTTKIKATTVAPGPEGTPLEAECEVTVFSIDVTLNSTVWDEKGEVYFAEFNTASLPSYTKLSAKQNKAYWTAAVGFDYLFAATDADDDEQMSEFYFVDPSNDYEAEYIAEYYWATDMTFGEVSKRLYGTYFYYITLIDVIKGEAVGVLNMSSYTDGDAIVGIAYMGAAYNNYYGVKVEYFWAIDTKGDIYQIAYYDGLGFARGKIGSTGISTNGAVKYSSLYYDFDSEYLFFSDYNGSDEVTLYAIDSETFDAYAVGQFPSSVWPVSGLCQYDSEAGDATDSVVSRLTNDEIQVSDDELEKEVSEKFDFGSSRAASIEKVAKAVVEEVADVVDEDEAVDEEAEDEADVTEEANEDEATVVEETTASDITVDETVPSEENSDEAVADEE